MTSEQRPKPIASIIRSAIHNQWIIRHRPKEIILTRTAFRQLIKEVRMFTRGPLRIKRGHYMGVPIRPALFSERQEERIRVISENSLY